MDRLRDKFRRRHNAFNRLLSRYAHVPAFAYSIEGGVWHFGMVPKGSSGLEIKLEADFGTVRVNESTVIASLARLAANRDLHKVLLCVQCGERWRVSERRVDRFCSQKCREAWYATSEGYHDRKAKNQRMYRQRVKHGHEAGASFR